MMNRYYILFLILFSLTVQVSVGQNFYSKAGTTITVTDSDIPLFVTDTIVNSGNIINNGDINSYTLINNGTLSNNGNLLIRGSWLSPGTYDAGEGQITFNSTNIAIPQIINHNNQSFSKLVISGGGVKQILADLTVEESLTLTDGIITAQGNHGVHFSSAAVITGGSDDSHINAPVYQQGPGTKVFPVGNGTTYLPVEISGITSTSEIGITLVELQAGQTLSTSASLEDISDKRYWSVTAAANALNNTRIILPYQEDEGLSPAAGERLVVAYSESFSDDFISIGRGTGSTSAKVQSEQAPAAGLVSLAILSEQEILPEKNGIVVFNAISPNPDDEINNYIHIDNLVETDVVSIYNRWGDLVFEMKNYVNDDATKRFNGQSNVGGSKDLPVGNYFYVIRRKAGKEVSGYLSLRK